MRPLHVPDPQFLPTAYTGALLACARERLQRQPARAGLELGIGGGYVIAGLLQAGVPHFAGVDVMPEAVRAASALLAHLGLQHRATLASGDMWQPVTGVSFDLIVANLPQFPLRSPLEDGHPQAWSDGGPDGRRWIEPFIDGLPAHLEPGGAAVMTHNTFVGLAQTCERLAGMGLRADVVRRVTVPLSPERVQALVRARDGREPAELQWQAGLLCVGPQVFAEFVVLEIRKSNDASS